MTILAMTNATTNWLTYVSFFLVHVTISGGKAIRNLVVTKVAAKIFHNLLIFW